MEFRRLHFSDPKLSFEDDDDKDCRNETFPLALAFATARVLPATGPDRVSGFAVIVAENDVAAAITIVGRSK